MPNDSSLGALKMRQTLTRIAEKQREAVEPSLADFGTVSAVSGSTNSLVAVKMTSGTSDGSQLLARVAGPTVRVGDSVALIPVLGGGYVAMKLGGSESSANFSQVPVGYGTANRFVSLSGTYTLGPLTGQLVTVNRVYYMPFFLSNDRTLDAIQYEVTAAVSGGVIASLYSCSTSQFEPLTRLASSPETIRNTTGIKTEVFTTPYAALGGRWYFAGIAFKGAMSVRGTSTKGNLPNILGWVDGNPVDDNVCIFREDITAGWTELPASANGVALANYYLHTGTRLV